MQITFQHVATRAHFNRVTLFGRTADGRSVAAHALADLRLILRWSAGTGSPTGSTPGAELGYEGFFPAGYFEGPDWARVEAALPLIAAAASADELWACLTADRGAGPPSHDPRLVGAGDDYEPVLDAIQAGCDGDEFSPPCEAMPGVFERIIPRVAALVGEAPALFAASDPLSLLRSGLAGKVTVSRAQVSSLLAMAFLGVGLPLSAYHRGTNDLKDELGQFPFPSMINIVWPKRRLDFPPNVHKVRCFLCYFSHFAGDAGGALHFQRMVASPADREKVSGLLASETSLCELDVQPLHSSIEDQRGCARVDFANRQVGGGVFLSTPGATAQEEISFATHPELSCAKLLCEQMADDEVCPARRHTVSGRL